VKNRYKQNRIDEMKRERRKKKKETVPAKSRRNNTTTRIMKGAINLDRKGDT
jgi:hypothetical protein